ncbi:hypothetical protein U14_05524 [Candidatus Moduliflexus flocculans]|uniref:Ice-binding protein C-terminal domain-containing protein n=1 Tax=Candidatus Moduliflexus flocculans TaxID=1499966 RepID=A0A081BS64_9BACT|nr:hypothetical protein U14_05524 [Candidatus Moduliflexus flocculans]
MQIEETAPYLCADLTICNGDFERGFEYWFSLKNSQLTPGRTGTGVHIDTDAKNSDIIQTIPGTFPTGATYRATAWCNASAGTTCQLFFGDSNVVNGPAYEHAGRHRLAGNGDWQQLSVTIAFTHQEQMQVYLYGGTGSVYDDVQITQVTPAPAAASSMMMTAREAAPETEAAPQPVPEPGMLALFGLGAAGLACLWRYVRRRS